ncbi:hypothetical protein P378_19055 [Desulforamulus profundi]|uniref:Uncharacterized protein n=1 Tax=Desulforamulus profundi TaxID=1383067 RepID=A0A2C6M4B0_9FIRM|nr:hypothetical protein P378_19055 [Desulforamulus profundi]
MTMARFIAGILANVIAPTVVIPPNGGYRLQKELLKK